MIPVASSDWNLLEEMVKRLGADAVRDAVDLIEEADAEGKE